MGMEGGKRNREERVRKYMEGKDKIKEERERDRIRKRRNT